MIGWMRNGLAGLVVGVLPDDIQSVAPNGLDVPQDGAGAVRRLTGW